MSTTDLAQAIEQDHRALDAFVKGDAEPLKALYSRRDDVTLANPFGPPARGWSEVAQTMERAASNYREARPPASSASPSMRPRIWRTRWRSSAIDPRSVALPTLRHWRFASRPYSDAKTMGGGSSIVTPIR